MEISKDIPAKTLVHRLDTMRINVDQKTATLELHTEDGHKQVSVDLISILATATDPQKAVIRGFFKAIIAAGIDVLESEVPEIFT